MLIILILVNTVKESNISLRRKKKRVPSQILDQRLIYDKKEILNQILNQRSIRKGILSSKFRILTSLN